MKSAKLSSAKGGIGVSLHLRLPVAVECRIGRIAGLLGDKTVDVLSAKKQPHVALANLPDDEKAVANFVARWGPMHSTKDYFITARSVKELLDYPETEAVRKLAAIYPAAREFFLDTQWLVIQHRDTLRKAWRADRSAIESMRRHVSANSSSWNFKSGRIEIGVPDLWTTICVLFLNDLGRHKAGLCERGAECPAPYFQKPRTDQKFCGGACTDEARKEIKRNWWHQNRGKQK